MANAFSELRAEMVLDADQVESGVSSAESSIGGLRKSMGALSAAGAALSAGGLAVSVNEARKFETAMVDLEKVTNPKTAEQMGSAIKDMSSTMPLAQTELAGISEQAGRLGVSGTDNIRQFTETTAKMATATDLSAQEAADSFARMTTLMGEPISAVQKIGDATNALSNNMATSSSEITDAATRSAGSLSNMGASSESILALNATMNTVSSSARIAGTRLRRLGQEMMNPKKIGKLSSALGMTADSFKQMRKEDPTKLIKMMAKRMGEGGSSADALRKALSTTSRGALSSLSQNLDGLNKGLGTTKTQFKEGGSLAEEFETASKTFSNQLQLLKNNLTSVAISIGNVLLPPLTGLVKWISAGVSAFQNFNESTGGVAGAVGLLVGLVGGLAGAFAAFWPIISASVVPVLASAGAALAGLLSPVGLLVAGVAALGSAFATNFGGIRDTTMQIVSVLRNQFLSIWNQLKATVLPILSQIAGAWQTQGARVESVAGGLFEQIGGKLLPVIQRLGARATQAIAWISSMWQTHGASILSTIRLISTNLSEGLIQAMAVVRSVIGGDLVQARGHFREFQTAVTNIWNAIWPRLKSAVITGLGAAWSWITGPGVAKAKAALGTLTTRALAAFSFARENVVPPLQTGLSKAWGWVRTKGVAIGRKALSTLVSSALTAWKWTRENVVPPVRNALSAAWQWVRTKGVTLAKGALRTLGRKALAAFSFGKQNILPKIQGGLSGAWSWVRGPGVTLAKGALGFLSKKGKTAFKFAKSDILPKVKGGLNGAWQWVRGPGVTKAKGALGFLSKQGQGALKFAKGDLVPKIRTGVQGMVGWLRGPGTSIAKRAFSFLSTQSSNTLRDLKLIQKISSAVSSSVSWLKTQGVAKFEAAFRAIGRGIAGATAAYLNRLPQLYARLIPKISTWLRNNGQRIIRQAFYVIGRGIRTAILALVSGPALAISAFESVIGGIANWLTSGGFNKLKSAFGRIISGLVNYAKTRLVSDLIGAFQFVVKGIFNVFKGLYQGLIGGSLIPKMFSEIVSAARSFGSRIIGWVTSLAGQWLGKFRNLGSRITGWLSSLVGTFLSSVRSLGSRIIGWVTSLASQWLGKFRSFGSSVVGWLRSLGNQFRTLVRSLGSDVISWATSLAGQWLGKFRTLGGDIISWLSSLAGQFIGGLRSLGSNVLGWAGSLVSQFFGFFQGLGSDLIGWVTSLGGQLISGFRQMGSNILGWAGSLVDQLVTKLTEAGGKMVEGVKGAFNEKMPDKFTIPSVKVGGKKLGGGSIDLPSLDVGGRLRSDGLYYGHAGETVVPADASTPYSGDTSTTGTQQQNVNVTLSVEGDDELARLIRDNVDVRFEEERKDIAARRTR